MPTEKERTIKEIRNNDRWEWPGKEIPKAWEPFKDFLPPRKHWPKFIWDFNKLPELREIPYEFNFGEFAVDRNSKRFPNKTALYYKDKKISWKELENEVNKIGNALKNLDIKQHDRIGICMPNQPTWLYTALACWKIGAVVTLFNHLLKPAGIKHQANDAKVKTIVTDKSKIEEVLKAKPDCKSLENVIAFGVERKDTLRYEDLVENESAKLKAINTNRFQFGRIIYTSGTTGTPKGALRTFDQMLASSYCHGQKTLGITSHDVIGGHPYFTFAFGSVNFTMNPWLPGCGISIIKEYEPEKQWKLVEKHNITQMYLVPTALKQMLKIEDIENKFDISSLRLIQSAADILPPETCQRWNKRFPQIDIVDSLGSSELDYWSTTAPGIWPEEKIDSIGYPVPGMENEVIDSEGNICKSGKEGEMVTRGIWGNLYINRMEDQKESVENGWNKTGLFATKDEDGCFYLSGRTVSLIKYSGYSVVGHEVATTLLGHEGISDCGVVGAEDPERGEIVKAYVIPAEGYDRTEEFKEELRDYVKERKAFYKVPRKIEFTDNLPRTVTGKVDLVALKEREEKK